MLGNGGIPPEGKYNDHLPQATVFFCLGSSCSSLQSVSVGNPLAWNQNRDKRLNRSHPLDGANLLT